MDAITDLPGYRITEQLYAGSRTLVYRALVVQKTPEMLKERRES